MFLLTWACRSLFHPAASRTPDLPLILLVRVQVRLAPQIKKLRQERTNFAVGPFLFFQLNACSCPHPLPHGLPCGCLLSSPRASAKSHRPHEHPCKWRHAVRVCVRACTCPVQELEAQHAGAKTQYDAAMSQYDARVSTLENEVGGRGRLCFITLCRVWGQGHPRWSTRWVWHFVCGTLDPVQDAFPTNPARATFARA